MFVMGGGAPFETTAFGFVSTLKHRQFLVVCEDDEKDYDSDHSSELEKIQREDRRRDAVWNMYLSPQSMLFSSLMLSSMVSPSMSASSLSLLSDDMSSVPTSFSSSDL